VVNRRTFVCRLVKMTQEIGQVDSLNGKINYDQFPIGTILFMFPYNVRASYCHVRLFVS